MSGQLGRQIKFGLDAFIRSGRTEAVVLEEPEFVPSDQIRASRFSPDRCPKLEQATARGIVQEEFTDADLWKFTLARYAAAAAKYAIRRHLGGLHLDASIEVPVSRGSLTGTCDMVINNGPDYEDDFPDMNIGVPIEIKRTDAYLDGLFPSHVWQTIAYAWMLGSPVGIILTLYDGKYGSYKVWPVVEVEGGWSVFNGVYRAQFSEAFPADDNGNNFFAKTDFDKALSSFEEWKAMYDVSETPDEMHRILIGAMPDGMSPYAPPCSVYVPADYYKTNGDGRVKGDLKPGTGEINSLCPLFRFCYSDRLPDTDDEPSAYRVVVGPDGRTNFEVKE